MLGRFCTWSLQMKVNGVSRQCKLFKLAVHFAKCSCKATTIKTLLVLNLFTHIQYSIVNIYTLCYHSHHILLENIVMIKMNVCEVQYRMIEMYSYTVQYRQDQGNHPDAKHGPPKIAKIKSRIASMPKLPKKSL